MKIIVAKTKNGKLIYLTSSLTHRQLSALKQKERFFCPACSAEMILKAGTVKIPHFAHRTLAECESFSEAETPLHLKGKMLLHQFFIKRNHPSELERYFSSIKQRADVLVENRLAIEYQCSAIPLSNMKSRTAGYQSIDIDVIWIHGMDYIPSEGISIMKLKPMELMLLQGPSDGDYLLGFNPEKDCFYYRSNLFYIGARKWIGKTKSLAADRQSFPFAVPRKLSAMEFEQLLTLAFQERQYFLERQRHAKNRYQNQFWVLCYELNLDRLNLPLYIGVPFLGSEIFKDHPIIWQLQALKEKEKEGNMHNFFRFGKTLLHNVRYQEAACQIMTDYLSFVEKFQEGSHTPQGMGEVLYAIYCKSAGKLRK